MKKEEIELIDKIYDAFEMINDLSRNYYNIETGEVVWISEFDPSITAKEAEDIEENWDKYIPLPSQYDLREYDDMEEFAKNYPNEIISQELLRAITGRGAFRRFKDRCYDFGIEKEWFSFRDKVLKEKAIRWCIENELIQSAEDD